MEKRYIVELTEREWRMIRLSLTHRHRMLEENCLPAAADYDELIDKLYDDNNYKPVGGKNR